ncbi:hypothetical protein ACFV99_08260 [Streptomyces sp. NPDC059944]|uniref:hypothetical protein n=1 Tax=unclassified Streptomyces TaxID=2593676 RepID=UPI0036646698
MDTMPFYGDGSPRAPFGADAISGLSARVCLEQLDDFRREATFGLDMSANHLTDQEMLEKVRELHEMRYIPPGHHGQEQQWEDGAANLMLRLTRRLRAALARVTNASGQVPTVLGESGTLDERLAAFRVCLREERPVVSVSASGCLSRWLATGDPMAMCLSVITYIPGRPVYAVLVTPTTALLSDCAGSWRLTLSDGWLAMTGTPLIAAPHPGYVVLPHSLADHAAALRDHYAEPLFPFDTSSAIAQAVLGGAVPVAVHLTEHVLNSAILPVAIGHGMIVVQQDSGELLEKPWAASKHLFKSLKGETEFGRGLVIARNVFAARRVIRVLKKMTGSGPDLVDPLVPFDFVDEDDGFDFDGPRDA